LSEQRISPFGLPFTPALALNLDQQKLRIENGKASLIIIEGIIGHGKTTLAIHIADYLNGAYEKLPDKKEWRLIPEKRIEIKKVIGLGGEDFFKKIRETYKEKGVVCVYDEAGEFSKRSTLSKFNQKMVQLFDVYRAFKICVIVILPFFHYLDNSLLQKGIPRFLIRIHNRTKTYGYFKVYDINQIEFLKHWLKKSPVVSWAYSHVSPIYHGGFYNLDPARALELDNYQTAGKLNILTGEDEEEKKVIEEEENLRKKSFSLADLNKTLKYRNLNDIRRRAKENLNIEGVIVKGTIFYSREQAQKILDFYKEQGRIDKTEI